jgi:hypothetical protein
MRFCGSNLVTTIYWSFLSGRDTFRPQKTALLSANADSAPTAVVIKFWLAPKEGIMAISENTTWEEVGNISTGGDGRVGHAFKNGTAKKVLLKPTFSCTSSTSTRQ